MQITDADIEALPAKDRAYKYSVGHALFILVRPNGKKYWRIKYRHDGKENTYSAGVFPKVSLNQALEANKFVKSMILEGKNPNEFKKAPKPPKKALTDNIFRLSLAKDGGMTIEANNTLLRLDPIETTALRSFLAIQRAGKGVTCA